VCVCYANVTGLVDLKPFGECLKRRKSDAVGISHIEHPAEGLQEGVISNHTGPILFSVTIWTVFCNSLISSVLLKQMVGTHLFLGHWGRT
jgi:hypothetical protein